MAIFTILDSISRSDTFPIEFTFSANYNCGTLSLEIDTPWSDQMLLELPCINVKIFKNDGTLFKTFDINMVTVNTNLNKGFDTIKPYSIPFYNIPKSGKFKITPVFDKYAISARNNLIECGIEEGDIWTTLTETFGVTIKYDNENVSSGSGSEGGGGGETPGSADQVTFDPTGTGLFSTNVQDAIIEVLGKTTTQYATDITLLAANWSGTQYTVSNSNIKLSSYIYIDIPDNLTQTQYNAVASANLACVNQTAGSVTLEAFGDVPTIDLPITIIVQNKNQ